MISVEDEVLKIVQAEQSGASWVQIGLMSERLLKYIAENHLISNVDGVLTQYLDDHDLRQDDEVYATYQLENVIKKLMEVRGHSN